MKASSTKASSACRMIKYSYSSILLVFSIILIIGNMFQLQTRLAHDSKPYVALIVMLLAIIWLTMVEGGQGALVGLGPVDPKLYKDSHPMTHRCTSIIYKGDNLDRYLLGRQFMVILIVFVVELCGATHSFEETGVELWGMPNWLVTIFLVSGVSMILFTCMVGQLNSEIISCHYMLDYRKCHCSLVLFLPTWYHTCNKIRWHCYLCDMLTFSFVCCFPSLARSLYVMLPCIQSTTGLPSSLSGLPWLSNFPVFSTSATLSNDPWDGWPDSPSSQENRPRIYIKTCSFTADVPCLSRSSVSPLPLRSLLFSSARPLCGSPSLLLLPLLSSFS
mmetsp:Transcript_1915/g.2748  ORF Transcript_1915/g.2748 Transcript_1915/m.2748 type:complete len:332 (+) Transcript_1915:217-1212(+)